MEERRKRQGRRWPYLLLLVPFVGTLYPEWYSRQQPELSGIPFFIWYQFAMILAGVAILLGVYLLQGEGEP